MKKIMMGVLVLMPALFAAVPSGVFAQEVDGNSYYTLSIDVTTSMLQHFTLSFTANTTDSADNATADTDTDETDAEDNATEELGGTVDVSIENKTFDNATGTFIARGPLFDGSWEGVEVEYSSYYQENIFTYYSYLFLGTVFFNDTFVAGLIFSTVTEESTSKGKIVQSGIVPFWGVLVSRNSRNY